MRNTALLSIEHLSIAFDSDTGCPAPVVHDVSLTVRAGECTAIVGESGSGKSLTALAVMRLLPEGARITGGDIRLDGLSLPALGDDVYPALRGNRIGMVFQDPMASLNPLHTIGAQIAEAIAVHRPELSEIQLQQAVDSLLTAVRLTAGEGMRRSYPHELSGGQRQRVVIAIAIANSPSLIIADEPTTSLDANVQRAVLDTLLNLCRERGIALLLISHDMGLVRRVADRMVVMQNGRVIEEIESGASAQHAYSRMLLGTFTGTSATASADSTWLAKLEAGALERVMEAEGLCVRYSPRRPGRWLRTRAPHTALHPFDTVLYRGECLGIIGESGSGKSTLAMALLRLIPSEGRITFLGKTISGLLHRELRGVRKKLQVVFQDPFLSLNPRLCIADLVAEGLAGNPSCTLSRAQIRTRVTDTLREVGLNEQYLLRFPHELSGGERQRAALARALVMAPEVLILDEPTSSLDRALQFQIVTLLRELQTRMNLTMIFISHDLDLVAALTHRVMVLHHGACVEQGLTEKTFRNPQSGALRALLRKD